MKALIDYVKERLQQGLIREPEELMTQLKILSGVTKVPDLPIRIEGRQVEKVKTRSEYVYNIKVSDGEIVIRIDDKGHLEFWLEIRIPMLMLAKLFEKGQLSETVS